MRITLGLLVGAMAVAGCGTVAGPEPIIGPMGLPPAPAGVTDASLITDFQTKAKAAAGNGAQTAQLQAFMRSGFALTYANCNSYFTRQGQHQTSARVGRDLMAPFVTLITGVIALDTFKHPEERDNLLSALSLGAAFATSGLDSYEEHFLFGAENIDAVRDLTEKALAKHASETLKLETGSFGQAVVHIIDNQTVCTPAHILALTREAIAEGRVQGRVTGTAQERRDRDIERALGRKLNPPSALATEELFALWWLFEGGARKGDSTETGEYDNIRELLAGLPEGSNPIETSTTEGKTLYSYKEWPPADEVKEMLLNLSPTIVAQFRKQRDDLREATAAAGTGPFTVEAKAAARAAQLNLVNNLRSLPVEETADGFQRVDVSIEDD